jgi:hypothetical protein
MTGGGGLVIYAEGLSDTAKILKPLKKGPFRLAVTVAGEMPQPLRIVLLGINYSEATLPGTTLWMNAGETIAVPALPAEEHARGSLSLMRAVAAALPPLVLDAGSKEAAARADEWIARAEKACGRPLRWEEARSLVDACRTESPFPHGAFRRSPSATARLAAGILLTPAGLPGLLFHAVPLLLARRLVKRKVSEADFTAPVFLVLAFIFILGWYILAIPTILLAAPARLLYALPLLAVSGILWNRACRPAWQDIFRSRQ